MIDLNLLIYISFGIEALLLIFLIVLVIKYRRMFYAYQRFMRSKKGYNLDEKIYSLEKNIDKLLNEDRDNKEAIRALNRFQRSSFQKIGVVKYNAFSGMGGNLSFALAVLDNTNTGFILNSLHSKEGCFNYIKYIETGKSDTVLGKEEQEALEKALGY